MAQEQPGKPRGQRQHKTRENYTAFDRALVSAASNGAIVRFTLASGDSVDATVKSVDRYFIEISTPDGLEWLNKGFIERCKVYL